MANEVRADPQDLADLAQANLTASVRLGDGLRGQQGTLAPPAAAFGDTVGGAGANASLVDATDDLGTTVGRLVAVYETDTDLLYQTAAAYQRADETNAKEIMRTHGSH